MLLFVYNTNMINVQSKIYHIALFDLILYVRSVRKKNINKKNSV